MRAVLQRLGGARLDYLDQMRALAIIPVVIEHYHNGWLPGGGMGVGIFFALSGFLIATILLEEPVFDTATVGRFILRRFMRIYPTYAAAIFSTVAVTSVQHPEKLNAVLSAFARPADLHASAALARRWFRRALDNSG